MREDSYFDSIFVRYFYNMIIKEETFRIYQTFYDVSVERSAEQNAD